MAMTVAAGSTRVAVGGLEGGQGSSVDRVSFTCPPSFCASPAAVGDLAVYRSSPTTRACRLASFGLIDRNIREVTLRLDALYTLVILDP